MDAMQIIYSISDYYGDGVDCHTWKISDADGVAAELYVSLDRNEIANIWTRPDRRGEGLARALYETACGQMDIYHATPAHRSLDGQGFAEAVGGQTVADYPCACTACTPITEELI